MATLALAPAARAETSAPARATVGLRNGITSDGPVITAPANNAVVNAVTFTGTAEAGATIVVSENDVEVARTTATDGTWTVSVPGLADGPHTFTASSATGTASVTVTLDTAAPDTTIDAGPEPFTKDNTPTFRFASDDPGATIECRVDNVDFAACGREFTVTDALDDGTHTMQARAVDAAGNRDPSAASLTFVVDTVAPAVPVISQPADGSTTRETAVTLKGTAEANAIVRVFDGDTLAGLAQTDGETWQFVAGNLADGVHAFRVVQVDRAGNESPAATASVTVDTVAPTVDITAGPSGPTNDTTPTFAFTAEAGATVTCALDGAALASCASPLTLDPQTEGEHSLKLTASDAAGNQREVVRGFIVDTTKPVATITAGPQDGATIDGTTLRFDIGFDQVGTTAVCVLAYNGDPLERQFNCSSFVESSLKNGQYTFSVTPTDAAGNVGDTVTRAFTVVHSGPQAVVVSGPSQPTNVRSPHFAIDGPTEAARFECSIRDVQAAVTCTRTNGFQPQPLKDGAYTFVVVATDANGDAGPEATREFVIDTKAPAATVSPAPAGPVRSVQFTLANSETGRLECRLDGLLTNCDTTYTPQVADGTHTLSVVAIDLAGNRSPAVTRSFTIDTVAPAAPEVTGAASGSTASFTFASSDGTFACRLEGPGRDGSFAPCTSPATYDGLAPGAYRFTLRTTDAAGNSTDAPARDVTIAAPRPASLPPVPTPVATPAPVAAFHKTVVVRAVSGTVLVKRPGSTAFAALGASTSIPLGSIIDAKAGKMQLTSQPRPGKSVQKALFYGGLFQVTQPGTMIELTLVEAFGACPKKAAAKPRTRQLWGEGKGNFRTKGRYSTASVQGTTWLVQDSCAGTLTRVKVGVVAVRDAVAKKTILLRAGKSYTARPKR